MQKANAIGGLLSILTAIVWVLIGAAGWSTVAADLPALSDRVF